MRGLMFMGLFGFLAGVFLAPKKGSELRGQIREQFELFQYSVEEKGKDLWQVVAPAAEQVKTEGCNLKSEGKALLRDAGQFVEKTVDSGKQTLEESQGRVSEKLAPVVSLIKEDAKEIKEGASEAINKVGEKFDDLKKKGTEAFESMQKKEASA
jgi:gas vesicle protein